MMTRKWMTALAVGGLAVAGMAGFGPASARPEAAAAQATPKPQPQPPQSTKLVTQATVIMNPTKDSDVRGWAEFTLVNGQVKVRAQFTGLAPGAHAFHIHEYGAWSEDGTAAGGEFGSDPAIFPGDPSIERAPGSFGNLTAGDDGKAELPLTVTTLKFSGAMSIVGRGLVIHQLSDDELKNKPPGAIDKRLAVGAVGVAKEQSLPLPAPAPAPAPAV